jgi:hypothetical protein
MMPPLQENEAKKKGFVKLSNAFPKAKGAIADAIDRYKRGEIDAMQLAHEMLSLATGKASENVELATAVRVSNHAERKNGRKMDGELSKFRDWLVNERGLSSTSADEYVSRLYDLKVKGFSLKNSSELLDTIKGTSINRKQTTSAIKLLKEYQEIT